jgi:hypothetical protein
MPHEITYAKINPGLKNQQPYANIQPRQIQQERVHVPVYTLAVTHRIRASFSRCLLYGVTASAANSKSPSLFALGVISGPANDLSHAFVPTGGEVPVDS